MRDCRMTSHLANYSGASFGAVSTGPHARRSRRRGAVASRRGAAWLATRSG